jgi:hypothetical protein
MNARSEVMMLLFNAAPRKGGLGTPSNNQEHAQADRKNRSGKEGPSTSKSRIQQEANSVHGIDDRTAAPPLIRSWDAQGPGKEQDGRPLARRGDPHHQKRQEGLKSGFKLDEKMHGGAPPMEQPPHRHPQSAPNHAQQGRRPKTSIGHHQQGASGVNAFLHAAHSARQAKANNDGVDLQEWLTRLGRKGSGSHEENGQRAPPSHVKEYARDMHMPCVDDREAKAWREGKKVLLSREEETALALLQQRRQRVMQERAKCLRSHGLTAKNVAGDLLYFADEEHLDRHVWRRAGKVPARTVLVCVLCGTCVGTVAGCKACDTSDCRSACFSAYASLCMYAHVHVRML